MLNKGCHTYRLFGCWGKTAGKINLTSWPRQRMDEIERAGTAVLLCIMAKKSNTEVRLYKEGDVFPAQPISIQLPPAEGTGKGHIKHIWSCSRGETTSMQVSNLKRVMTERDQGSSSSVDDLALFRRHYI